ncbi:MAG: tetratricopeptide repeat protein [Prevotellaceae bacterium]|nr:tetratricopeptide repeat protein [Prevotellaceae bacterium]
MRIVVWCSLLMGGLLAGSCAYRVRLPVSDPAKVKPLSDAKQMEKQWYFTEAMKQYEFQNWQDAGALFRKTIEIDPGCDACFYALANIYFYSDYPTIALSLSQSALRLDSTNFWYRKQLAQIYATIGYYDTAVAEYRRLLQVQPAMENLYFDLAAIFVRLNQPDSALAVLQCAHATIGFSEQLAGVQIELLIEQDRTEQAAALLEQLVEMFPEARYYTLLAEQYDALHRDSLSLQAFQKALSLNADFAPALLGEMDYYRRTGDFETFFQKMHMFCANAHVDEEYKTEYLSAVLQLPSFVKAFASQLDSAFLFLRMPPTAQTEPLYASFLLHTSRADSAVSVLRTSLQNRRDDRGAWHRYTGILYYLTRWDTLNVYAGQAHERFPDEAEFISLKAVALWQLHREAEAIEWFEKSLPLVADNPPQLKQAYAFLGDLYYAEKNAPKAYDYYEKALAIDSTFVIVLNNYAYFLSEENRQLDKAYAMSQRAIKAEPDNATYLDTFGWILYKMGKVVEAKTIFRHAMVHGGKESAVILDHYGDVLYALGETDVAVLYWEMALQKENLPDVRQKIKTVNKP